MVEQQNNVLDAALKAGAQYLVRVAGGRAVVEGAIRNRSSAAATHAIEERLKASGIKWVILRPGLFMQNAFGAGGLDQDRRQDGAAVRQGPAGGASSTCATPAR